MTEKLSYKTIQAPTTALFKDRGSKFLAYAFPVMDVQEVKAYLKNSKEEHPKAVHHCYAYRLGVDDNAYRANDDGEPSGSAGKPILGQIDSAGITNVLVIVVRYFGGTLLGVPGLIHAYKVATADALQQALIVEKPITKPITIACDYQQLGEVLFWLQKVEAVVQQQDLQLFCTVKAAIPIKNWQQFANKFEQHPHIKWQDDASGTQ